MIVQGKLQTCTDKLTRPIDLFDPWQVALYEVCYLYKRDDKSMFSYQLGEQAK